MSRLLAGLAAVLFLLLPGACTDGALERASRSYRDRQDLASLEVLHSHLAQGLPRVEVERLLGEPDYSPIDGQYYYGSAPPPPGGDHGEPEAPVGLVVDYRDASGEVTDQLQSFALRPIAE